MPNTSGRAVTLIERIGTQAHRLEAMANALSAIFGDETKIVADLRHEVVVSQSILLQAKGEATAKVEAKVEESSKPDLPPVPEEVQAVLDGIVESFRAAGLDVEVVQMPVTRGPIKDIRDILKNL